MAEIPLNGAKELFRLLRSRRTMKSKLFKKLSIPIQFILLVNIVASYSYDCYRAQAKLEPGWKINMGKTRSIKSLSIDSTVLCCNFVNTQSSWTLPDRYDYLQTYDDFIEWCLKVNISSRERLQALRKFSVQQPEDAKAALSRIKEIRSILQGLISAVAKNNEEELLHFLPSFNLLLRLDAVSRQRLTYKNRRFTRDQVDIAGDLTAPVWLVVESLATLLVENDLARIKECPKCGWVFLDETKNGKRKWCNPKYCGTSDKMKRYNDRKKTAGHL